MNSSAHTVNHPIFPIRSGRIVAMIAGLLAFVATAPALRAQGPPTGVEKVRIETLLSVDRAPAGHSFEAAVILDAEGRERPDTRVLGYMPPEAFLEQAGL